MEERKRHATNILTVPICPTATSGSHNAPRQHRVRQWKHKCDGCGEIYSRLQYLKQHHPECALLNASPAVESSVHHPTPSAQPTIPAPASLSRSSEYNNLLEHLGIGAVGGLDGGPEQETLSTPPIDPACDKGLSNAAVVQARRINADTQIAQSKPANGSRRRRDFCVDIFWTGAPKRKKSAQTDVEALSGAPIIQTTCAEEEKK